MKFSREEMRKALLLYAITDRRWLSEGETLAGALEQALQGGVTLVQVREKELPEEDFVWEVRELLPLCRRYGVPLIVNDSVEVALAADADGVHVGQSDILGRDIRALIGPGKILGITAKTTEQAKAAEAAGADYIGTGAVFGSSTKSDARAMSVETFRGIAESVEIPAVAIGGICRENINRLAGCKAAGVAVVSGIFAADDIRAAASGLKARSRALFG